MTVLTPVLLLGFAALAVPILLHLFRRREGRTLDFPALRYLRRTTRQHARLIRLRQLLLLALRLCAVVLAVLAGARLVLPVGGQDHPPAGLVLVVDNGLTSGAIVGDARVLDSLRVLGERALERTGPRDRVWVLAAGEPWRPAPPLSPEEAARELRRLVPTHVTPDLTAALERAGSLLEAGAPEIGEILLLSDLRREALPSVRPGTGARSTILRIAPAPAVPASNRGVRTVEIPGGLVPREGDPGEVQVWIQGNEPGGVGLRLHLEDRLVAAARTDGNGQAVLSLPPLEAGWIEGRVEVDPDDLRADDRAYFTFPVIPPPAVRTWGTPSPYLREALGVLEDAGRIRQTSGETAAVHIVAGEPTGPVPETGDLAIVPPEDPSLLPSTNRLLEGALPGWRLEPVPAFDAPELAIEGGTLGDALPARPHVRRAYRIVPGPAPAEWEALISLTGGTPWLAAVPAGDRTVLLLGSPLTSGASDLPLSASMIPLVDRLTTPGGESLQAAHRAGEALPLPRQAAGIRLPDGTLRNIDGMRSFSETGQAGIYVVLDSDREVIGRAAVNPSPPAPEAPLAPAEAAERLRPAWDQVSEGGDWPGGVLAGRRGREVGWALVAGLLLVLVAEGWLAAGGTGRRNGSGAAEGAPVPDSPAA